MIGTVRSVITGEHLIKCRYVVLTRKQQETGCCLLVLNIVWWAHLLNLYIFTMQYRRSLLVSSETWKCLASSLQVWLLFSYICEKCMCIVLLTQKVRQKLGLTLFQNPDQAVASNFVLVHVSALSQ